MMKLKKRDFTKKSSFPECQGTPWLKQAPYLKFK